MEEVAAVFAAEGKKNMLMTTHCMTSIIRCSQLILKFFIVCSLQKDTIVDIHVCTFNPMLSLIYFTSMKRHILSMYNVNSTAGSV